MRASGLIQAPEDMTPLTATPVHQAGVTVAFVDITPHMARTWLRVNKGNRALRRTAVDAYARDMRAGNWLPTHQGIAFSAENQLLDGQHRLEAIVQADVTVRMLVTRGLQTNPKGAIITTMDAVDRGALRSVADQLKIQHGIRNGTNTAAAAVAITKICLPHKNIKRLTVAQVLGVIGVYGREIEGCVANRSELMGLRSSAVLGAIAFARKVHPKEADEFQERLKTGAGLGARSPILHLRNHLLSGAAKGAIRGSNDERNLVADRTLTALLAFVQKRDVDKLATGPEGAVYYREAQKENVKKVTAIFV